MIKLVNCKTCGSLFETKHSNYCSRACRPHKKTNCLECNKEIYVLKKSDKFCNVTCRKQYGNKQNLLKNLELYKDTNLPSCAICGFKADNLQNHILKKHNLRLENYKRHFNKNTKDIFSSVYLMKLSEANSGEKNAWYNHGGKMSPFSLKNNKYKQLSDEEKQLRIKKSIDKANLNKTYDTNIDYYISKGMSEEEAKTALKKRQTTFSKEKCIEKYGEEVGLKKWQNRQEKWQRTLTNKPMEEQERINQSKIWKSGGQSRISQELFNAINIPGSRFGIKTSDNLGEKMEEIILIDGVKKKIMLDFCYKNKVIEFNGDYWHANPKKYADESIIFKRRKGYITAKQVRNSDEQKYAELSKKGYIIKVIWELDFRQNKEEVIKECLNFLNTN